MKKKKDYLSVQYYFFRNHLEETILEMAKRINKNKNRIEDEKEEIAELIYTARNFVNRRNQMIKKKGLSL